jgi:acetylornithine deacetylase/succinyl-diaminopimelate desuccinylase-like protein
MENIKSYVQENKDRFINELIELLKMPSVSADAAYSRCYWNSEVVKLSLEKQDVISWNLWNWRLPNCIWWKIIDKDLPTVLFTVIMMYNRQTQWNFGLLPIWACDKTLISIQKEPFFARGACDDKGQMYMHVKAFEYMIQSNTLPCNVKFMIEGEEVGSVNLKPSLKTILKNLKWCDFNFRHWNDL